MPKHLGMHCCHFLLVLADDPVSSCRLCCCPPPLVFQVVCTTLTGVGQRQLERLQFDVVVIDEAAQASC